MESQEYCLCGTASQMKGLFLMLVYHFYFKIQETNQELKWVTWGKIIGRILHRSCVSPLPCLCFTSHAPSSIHSHSQTSWNERSPMQGVHWEPKASVSFTSVQPQGTLRMLWVFILRTDNPGTFSSSVSYLLETLLSGWPQAWRALSNSIPFSCYLVMHPPKT